jgi:hypothetical protein
MKKLRNVIDAQVSKNFTTPRPSFEKKGHKLDGYNLRTYPLRECPETGEKVLALILVYPDNNLGYQIICRHKVCPHGRKHLCTFQPAGENVQLYGKWDGETDVMLLDKQHVVRIIAERNGQEVILAEYRGSIIGLTDIKLQVDDLPTGGSEA